MTLAASNAILAHDWGVSEAADRVFAEVCGRAPSTEPWRRWVMIVQAYFDESYTDGGVYVVAGYMARVENWAAFAADREPLLSKAYPGSSGVYRFKMSEMARRMDDVHVFYNVIQKYATFRASIMINEVDLDRAKERLWSDNVELIWTPDDSIANLMFRLFVSAFYEWCWKDNRIRTWIMPGDKIDIYIDNEVTGDWVLDRWEEMTGGLPSHIKEFVGEKPRFVDDEFLAWWIRRGYETGTMGQIDSGVFGNWSAPNVPGFVLTIGEDDLVENLISTFKFNSPMPAITNIYDSKVTPKNHKIMPIREFKKRANFLSHIEKYVKSLRRRPPF
jgi:hypothetical protein